MPAFVSGPDGEKAWNKAKQAAEEQYPGLEKRDKDRFYAIVTTIMKKICSSPNYDCGGFGEGKRSMKEIIMRLEESRKKMGDYDWRYISQMMRGKILSISKDKKEVEMLINNKRYHLWDNGGELNITKEEPVGRSVLFHSALHPGGAVGPITLAYRIQSMIDGDKIDYKLDLD